MLVISNGSSTLSVTKGAYESVYKYQGYNIVGRGAAAPSPDASKNSKDTSNQAEIAGDVSEDDAVVAPGEPGSADSSPENRGKNGTPENEDPEEASEDEEEDEEELSEIPITEMTKSQLLAYAEELGIEVSGDETKRELRVAIREALG